MVDGERWGRQGGREGEGDIRIFLQLDTEQQLRPPRPGWLIWQNKQNYLHLPLATSKHRKLLTYLQKPGLGQASQSNMFSRSAKTEPEMFSNILLMFLHFLSFLRKPDQTHKNWTKFTCLISVNQKWKKIPSTKTSFNTHFSVITGSFCKIHSLNNTVLLFSLHKSSNVLPMSIADQAISMNINRAV